MQPTRGSESSLSVAATRSWYRRLLDTLEPDRTEAARYIEALTGSADAAVTFQTFTDPQAWRDAKSDKYGNAWPLDPEGKPRDPLARWMHGTLAQRWGEIGRWQRAGAGVYVMVNEGDGKGRTAAHVRALRALFVEDDEGTLTVEALNLAPSMIVQSRNGLHVYWRLRPGERVGAFKPAQKALAAALGTDASVNDPSRVLRLPGSYHLKDPAAPFLVRLVQMDAAATYTVAEVLEANGATLEAPPPKALPSTAHTAHQADAFRRALAWIAEHDNAAEGGRNTAAYAAAEGLLDFPITDAEAFDLLRVWNHGNAPPLEEGELRTAFDNATKYRTNPRGWRSGAAASH
jgi:hypothetical protein